LAPAPALSAQEQGKEVAGADTQTSIVFLKNQPQEPWTDSWGAEKNFGLAIAEAYLGNFLPWVFNEYVRTDLKITQISPRSWWRNIEHGFGWDDNHFSVNHFAHPIQGNMYYNSARSNGFGYWTGLIFALAGSFHWECCGESHLMSVNDWVNTSIGGAAVGEMMYRTTSMILDNQATGSGRAWREVGTFALNPTRGFSRLTTGRASKIYANPEHPNDWVPDELSNFLSVGARRVGDGRLSDGSETHAFAEMDLTYGSILDLERQKPFDFFTLGVQINARDKKPLGRLVIRGNLWHKDLKRTESVTSKFLIVQDFDYHNNNAYEFGGQSVSAMWLARRSLSERVQLTTEVSGSWMIMGAVDSEFALEAEVPGLRERLREYDFGTGVGGRLGGTVFLDGRRLFDAAYRVTWLNTLNGSNANGEDANHVIQSATVRTLIPVSGAWGVGVDGSVFLRNSYFSQVDFEKISSRTPELRVYATWHPSRR